jgi:hypothetical protein
MSTNLKALSSRRYNRTYFRV